MSKKEEKTAPSTPTQSVKVLLRRLPKYMTEQEVMEQISPLPEEVTGTYFTPANSAFERWSFATLTLLFSEYCESLVDFEQRFNGYIFVDSRGNDSAAVVEAAVNQKFGKCDRARLKEDSRVGAILNDKYYLEFCEKLEKERAVPVMTLEQQIRLLNKPEDARTQINRLETPLVKFFMEREMGRRREGDARKVRREEKRAAIKQKNVMDILMKTSTPASSVVATADAPPKEKKEINAKDKEKLDAKRKERDALRKKKFLEEKKRKREERELEQAGGEKPTREYKKKERPPKERPGRPSPAKTVSEQQGEDWIKKLTDPKANIKKKNELAVDSKLTLLSMLNGQVPASTQKSSTCYSKSKTLPNGHHQNPNRNSATAFAKSDSSKSQNCFPIQEHQKITSLDNSQIPARVKEIKKSRSRKRRPSKSKATD